MVSENRKETVLTDCRRRKIACYSWVPQNPLFQVILVHGYSEHAAPHFAFAEELYSQNIAIHMMDLPGHGKSGGKGGDLDCFQDLVEELDWFMNTNQKIDSKLRTFLIGHSMGGLISALYTAKYGKNLAGLILASPLTGFSILNSWFRKALAHLLALSDPTKPYPTPFVPKFLCRDRSKWIQYYRDPYRIYGISPQYYLTMTDKFRELKRQCSNIKLPTLIFQGEKDLVVSPNGTFNFFNRIASPDKSIVTFAHAVHELFQEQERAIVVPKIIRWMKVRA